MGEPRQDTGEIRVRALIEEAIPRVLDRPAFDPTRQGRSGEGWELVYRRRGIELRFFVVGYAHEARCRVRVEFRGWGGIARTATGLLGGWTTLLARDFEPAVTPAAIDDFLSEVGGRLYGDARSERLMVA
jgi:hypothetical protein